MKQIVFATNNQHKLSEVREMVSDNISILSLNDINCQQELPETGFTIHDNACEKALFVFSKFKHDCFADDTGLEIAALEGRPGVYSARYAGLNVNFDDNIDKVLVELQGKENRRARFLTVICLLINGKKYCFEGVINGQITETRRGTNGFGYDPIFLPNNHNKTFAEMTSSEKNSLSHRFIAFSKMIKSGHLGF